VFPEQIVHWTWMKQQVEAAGRPLKVLNLFGYTGVASLVAAAAGAEVTHVDASKKAIGWARENQALSRLDKAPIRWICEDAMKFILREERRGNTYDIILTDPPKFGRGPNGEVWHLFEHLPLMLDICREILSPKAVGLVLTAYSIRASFYSIHELMRETMRGAGGVVESGELVIREAGLDGKTPAARFPPPSSPAGCRNELRTPRQRSPQGGPGEGSHFARQSHHQGHQGAQRQEDPRESGTFMAEGLKLVIDAIELGWTIRTLVYAKAAKAKPLVEQMAAKTVASGGLVLEVSEKVLSSITRRDNPQMVVGIFESRWKPLRDIRPGQGETWIALDRVRDPGNLGTIIRTADAAGASGVILVGETTDPFSLETVRATMGSVFAVPVARATPEEFIAWKKQAGVSVVATHLAGSVDYRTIDYKKKPVVILMGNEQSGLPEQLAREADALARIPQQGLADSLNLAVASAVMLFEARRHLLSLSEAK
jgi:TrmH family RNA methyltransferase